jgi:hypothetical protein
MRILSIMYLDVLVWVVLDVVDAVRQYTFICVEIKSVSETFIS